MTKSLSKNRIKYLASLQQKKYRQIEEKFLVEGVRFCEEAVKSSFTVESLFYTQKFASSTRGEQLLENAQSHSIEIVKATPSDLAKFSDTVHSQGVSALIRMPPPPSIPKKWPDSVAVLVLDSISDPGNMGTIIRTADWFALDVVFLGQGCVELFNPKVLRSTMGSVFHLPIFENLNLVQELANMKREGMSLCAGDANNGMPLDDFEWPSKVALMVGSEPKGINPQLHNMIDNLIHIPKFGKAESLNVATATGIMLFAFTGTRKDIKVDLTWNPMNS